MDFQKVLRSLPHLSPVRATAVCGALLAKLHLLARGDKVDTRGEERVEYQIFLNGHIQGVFFNWSYPKNYKFFSVSKMF